jgi:hypothetical protein
LWAGTFGDCLAGPHVSPLQLTRNHYPDILLHDLPELLEVIPLSVSARMWYMHDGAPAHFSCAVRHVLNNTHHDEWIGRGAPTVRPPPYPDLNPLNFYLWGHQKSFVCVAPAGTEKALHHCIMDVCQTICNYTGIFEWMPRHLRCVEGRIQSHGRHFEPSLQMYSFSYNSQVKCFRTHIGMNIFS